MGRWPQTLISSPMRKNQRAPMGGAVSGAHPAHPTRPPHYEPRSGAASAACVAPCWAPGTPTKPPAPPQDSPGGAQATSQRHWGHRVRPGCQMPTLGCLELSCRVHGWHAKGSSKPSTVPKCDPTTTPLAEKGTQLGQTQAPSPQLSPGSPKAALRGVLLAKVTPAPPSNPKAPAPR